MGVPDPTKELVSKKGIRVDGRKADEIRPIHIEAGILHRADGSAYLEWGGNKVIAAVYGPRELNPRRFQEADKAVVQCRYSMAAFSTSDRKRPGPDRRSQEISKVISDAFENVVLTEKYPRGAIDIHVEILEANAGTRCAAVVCASVALADAGIPMKFHSQSTWKELDAWVNILGVDPSASDALPADEAEPAVCTTSATRGASACQPPTDRSCSCGRPVSIAATIAGTRVADVRRAPEMFHDLRPTEDAPRLFGE